MAISTSLHTLISSKPHPITFQLVFIIFSLYYQVIISYLVISGGRIPLSSVSNSHGIPNDLERIPTMFCGILCEPGWELGLKLVIKYHATAN